MLTLRLIKNKTGPADLKQFLLKNGNGYIWQNPHDINKTLVINCLKKIISDLYNSGEVIC